MLRMPKTCWSMQRAGTVAAAAPPAARPASPLPQAAERAVSHRLQAAAAAVPGPNHRGECLRTDHPLPGRKEGAARWAQLGTLPSQPAAGGLPRRWRARSGGQVCGILECMMTCFSALPDLAYNCMRSLAGAGPESRPPFFWNDAAGATRISGKEKLNDGGCSVAVPSGLVSWHWATAALQQWHGRASATWQSLWCSVQRPGGRG